MPLIDFEELKLCSVVSRTRSGMLLKVSIQERVLQTNSHEANFRSRSASPVCILPKRQRQCAYLERLLTDPLAGTLPRSGFGQFLPCPASLPCRHVAVAQRFKSAHGWWLRSECTIIGKNCCAGAVALSLAKQSLLRVPLYYDSILNTLVLLLCLFCFHYCHRCC